MARPIYCACGRALQVRVARDGLIFRCPEHGVQFRFIVQDKPPPTAPLPKKK